MAKIRVTKEFHFEMAHALWNYDGPCANIHGHSYKLLITILGEPINDDKNPKTGMVIDFGDLKKIVHCEIIDKMDHAIVLNKKAFDQGLLPVHTMFTKQYLVNFQPTCENLVLEMVQILKPKLPSSLSLFSIKLYETATSYAEWYASDNN